MCAALQLRPSQGQAMPPVQGYGQGVGKAHDTARSSSTRFGPSACDSRVLMTSTHRAPSSTSRASPPPPALKSAYHPCRPPRQRRASRQTLRARAQGSRARQTAPRRGYSYLWCCVHGAAPCEMVADRAAPRQERSWDSVSSQDATAHIKRNGDQAHTWCTRTPPLHAPSCSERTLVRACMRAHPLSMAQPSGTGLVRCRCSPAGVALTQS